MVNEIKRRYFSGEAIPARDFNNKGLEFFGEVVFQDWVKENTTAQEDLWQELHWKRNHPLIELTPEQEHLMRVETSKNAGQRRLV